VTIYGPDISSYQNGLDLSQLSAASFVIAKTTEGTYYTDSGYQGWRQQAARLGKPFVWYHFLSGEDSHAQVAHTAANVGDASLPGMLDVEPAGSFSPSMAQVLGYVDAAASAGLHMRLIYLPRWYWQQMGSPDLTPLASRGLALVASAYPGGSGSPQQLYPGDSAAGWQSYGGLTPLLYQYTNQALDGGKPLDYNAFRGTLSDLLTSLGANTMGTIPPSISQKWPELAGDFPPNAPFTDESALIWADGGARAAALYAQQARDAVNALAAKINTPAPIDVNALAAALGPVLKTGPTADEVAAAVVAHLASTLQKG
jgi:hypothetical protein